MTSGFDLSFFARMQMNSKSLFRLILLLSLLLQHDSAFGQSSENYINSIANLPDEEKIKQLLAEAEKLKYTQPEVAESFLKAAERIAAINDLTIQRGDICISLAAFYWYRGDYVQSFDCSRKALDIFIAQNDSIGMANSFMGVGIGYSEFGLPTVSTEYLIESLKLYEAMADTHGIVSVYINLSDNYSDQKQFDLARMYLEKAERATQSKSDDQYIDVLLNMGGLMNAVGDLRKAQAFFEDVIVLATRTGYEPAIVWALTEQANIAMLNGNIDLAIEISEKAYLRAKVLDDSRTLTKILITRSGIEKRKRAFGEAIKFADEAFNLAKQKSYHTELLSIVRLRSDILQEMGNTNDALDMLRVYVRMQDSIYDLMKDAKINTLALLYETDKRDNEIRKLKQDQLAFELTARQNKLAIFVFVVFVLFLAVFAISRIRALRIRKKANSLLEAQREKLHKANVRLEEEKRIAENANRAKSEFLATVTHELRTPLNAVLGLTELIDRGNKDPELKEMLTSLRFSGGNLLNIINNILDYKSFERGIIELNIEKVNLGRLHVDLLASTSAMLAGKPIEVRGSIGEGTALMVEADKLRLIQIFTNMLGNSVKFTNKGFIDFSFRSVLNEEDEMIYEFEFEDSGVGMPDDAKEYIFESFSRVPGETEQQVGGTGLGLNIVKMLTDMMDGTITLKTEQGRGSKFTIRIPLTPIEDSNQDFADEGPNEAKKPAIPNLSDIRVLVVDDNDINLFVAGKLLEQEGFKSVLCDSGAKAVEMCKNESFDIVLMDLQMPGMDGIEAALHIRKIRPDLPVVALTAGEKDEFYMKNHGDTIFAAFLRKPFETEVLVDLINRKSIGK